MTRQIVLRLSCADVPGIVADVARFVFESGLNIVESAQFYDSDTGRFFMRVVADPVEGKADLDALRAAFTPHAARWAMDCELHDTARRPRAVIRGAAFGHALNDRLRRSGTGRHRVETPAVASNHTDSYRRVAAMGIP